MNNKSHLLELKNIEKSYGNHRILKNINLTINRGEFIAIIGQSGSGKSTLLNILGALDKPTEGSIFFKEKDISKCTSKELAKFRNEEIGFIFQFHYLLPEFTVLENLLIPTWIMEKTSTLKFKDRALSLLKEIGLENLENRKISQLSGGQQQRVAIARALMNNSSLILADEPTGNLDSKNTLQVYDLLRKINRETETTFIIVTHDETIAQLSNRIIKIIDGEIVQDTSTL